MLQYSSINSFLFSDNSLAHTTPSTCGKKYAQLYVSDKGFVMIYPMRSQ